MRARWPIPCSRSAYITIDNFYTATVYEKGAEVIGMLKTLVGDEDYRKATDLYFERHDGQAATVEQWVKCFEDACGRDLRQFRLWYAQSGTPGIEAKGEYDAANNTYALTLKQSLAPTPGQTDKKPMHIPVRLGFVGAGGRALPLTLEGENADGTGRARARTDECRTALRVRRCGGSAATVYRTGLFGAGEFQDADRIARPCGADGA